MTYLQAIIIAIIEGLTEFLPISSTGHMVIASSLMGIEGDAFTKLFEVVIQMGAILSVVVLYWRRFVQSFDIYIKLAIAFVPTAIIGLLFYKHIKAVLAQPLVIATVLLLGGIILLFIDKYFEKNEHADNNTNTVFSYKNAFIVGCFQSLAVILPGLSRAAATIIGGLSQGFNRKTAAEFSFLLAVPTMAAASLKDGYEYYKDVMEGALPPLSSEQVWTLVLGNVVAFIVALVAIKSFIGFLTNNGFKIFGWYRIVVGLLILGLYFAGYELFVD